MIRTSSTTWSKVRGRGRAVTEVRTDILLAVAALIDLTLKLFDALIAEYDRRW